MKRFIFIIFCILMTISGAGCSHSSLSDNSGQSVSAADTTSDKTADGTSANLSSGTSAASPGAEGFVYVPKYISADLDSISNAYNYNTAVFLGDTMYFSSTSFNLESPASTIGYQIKKMDLNTGEITAIGNAVYNGQSVQLLAVSDSGNIVLLTDYNAKSSSLTVLDSDGSDITPSGLALTLNTLTKSWSSLYMKDLEVDNDGNIYILTSGAAQMIIVLDPEGILLCQINIHDAGKSLCRSSDGRVFLLCFEGGDGTAQAGKLRHIDLETGQLGESYEGIPGGYGSTSCHAGGENEILINIGLDLYRYDLETRACEKLFNWIDCDVECYYPDGFGRTDDGRIAVLNFTSEMEPEIILLTETPASEVPQKTVLTYAVLRLDAETKADIVRFNKSNSQYRITVKEYGNGDVETGRTELNNDLLHGNLPDIINLEFGDMNTYISKGLLTDLYALLDGDTKYSRDDFVQSLLGAYEKDGKLYGLPTSFTLETLVGLTSHVGHSEGWTVDDALELMSSQPSGTELIADVTRDEILQKFVMVNMDSLVDWDTGTCYFDGEDFIKLLKLASFFPSETELAAKQEQELLDGETLCSKIQDGSLLMYTDTAAGIGSMQQFLCQIDIFKGDVNFVGYPTFDGSNGSVFSTNLAIGIMETSPNKEGAWQFICSKLTREYQISLSYEFPVPEEYLQEELDSAATITPGMTGWGKDGYVYYERRSTAEETDLARRTIDSAHSAISYNVDINTILSEEAQAYFYGQKPAEAVVKTIQSRVQLYVNENR